MDTFLKEMKYRATEYPFKDITEKIISCAIEVHSNLGPGLLESVYEEALAYEFDLRGIKYQRQRAIELKATEGISNIYVAQVLTYLRATKKRVGLLINFNVERLKEGIKRLIV